ncbi:BrnA antitoxin family protein [Pseudomonas knackmussii]|uniref:BrnA antitoxin family protein n=1 Tax=Pseudomonas knackmussii TaxID=65741 RepID=UPI001362EE94|nr:BrnA antitoxin family protein [Pseudomonas knackmussii]
MPSTSTTGWSCLAGREYPDIGTGEIPVLGEDFYQQPELRVPAKQSVTIRLDLDELASFKELGAGLRPALREYVQAPQGRRDR